jgi:hypothetical protein
MKKNPLLNFCAKPDTLKLKNLKTEDSHAMPMPPTPAFAPRKKLFQFRFVTASPIPIRPCPVVSRT